MKDSPALFLERYAPYAVSAVSWSIWYYYGAPFPRNADALLATSATVASIFASFLGVAMAIILTVKKTESFRVIERLGYANTLFNYIRSGILGSVLLACVSVIGFFVINSEFSVLFSSFWVISAVFSLVTYYRVTSLIFKLLRQSEVG